MHPGYVPLSKRCDITADVFKRYGYAEAHKKPALQEVLKEMRRPTEDCTGLQKGPWMASVERLRNAQNRKSGGLDTRPVPSWNFRFGAGISSDPAPLPPPPPVRVPPPGEANLGPLPRQPSVTQEARRLKHGEGERPTEAKPARRPSGQEQHAGQEETKKRLGRKEAEVDAGQRSGAKVKRPESKPSRDGSQQAVQGSKKSHDPQASAGISAASPEPPLPHGHGPCDVPSDPPAPGDEQKAPTSGPAQGQGPLPAPDVPSGPLKEPKPPTPSFGRGASCSSVEELRTEPCPLGSFARGEETLQGDTTARPHGEETLLGDTTARPHGEETLPGGTTARPHGEESGSSSQEPAAPGPPSPDAHLVAWEEPQSQELPAASSPSLDEEATGDCRGEAQAQEAPT